MKKKPFIIAILISILIFSNIALIYNNIKCDRFSRQIIFGEINNSIQNINSNIKEFNYNWDYISNEKKNSIINNLLFEIRNSNYYCQNIKWYYSTINGQDLNMDTASIFKNYSKYFEKVKNDIDNNKIDNNITKKELITLVENFNKISQKSETIYNKSKVQKINIEEFKLLLSDLDTAIQAEFK